MKLAARIFLLFTGTLLLAHYLPAGFWLIADQRQRPPMVFYSCVEKRFLLFRSENGEIRRTDTTGTLYDREDFERLLPLDNYLQLYKEGRMPKEIDGIEITPEKLHRNRVNLRLKPEVLDSPSVALTPLLEAESGRVRLEMPADFMRLGKSIEFISAKSNKAIIEKTAMFQQAFSSAGFVFPVKIAGGNPSTLKPYDEGYYLVDSTDAIFHLRQVGGKPELQRLTDLVDPADQTRWTGLKPRFLHVQEQDNREVRVLIIGHDGDVHAVVGKDYQLVRLPLKHFDPTTMQLTLRGDLINRFVTVSSPAYVETVVLNRSYEFVDRYAETLGTRATRPAGKLAATLFPAALDFEAENSGFLGFRVTIGNLWSRWLNLGWLGLFIGWMFVRGQPLSRRLPELMAVGIGGVFGVIAVLLIPRTE